MVLYDVIEYYAASQSVACNFLLRNPVENYYSLVLLYYVDVVEINSCVLDWVLRGDLMF